MSKKDKSKFRKQIKAQLSQEMSKFQSSETQPKSKTSIFSGSKTAAPEIVTVTGATAVAQNSEIDLAQIKHDLKKTAILIFILASIIGVLYYLDSKYDILLTFGNWIFKVLHIG